MYLSGEGLEDLGDVVHEGAVGDKVVVGAGLDVLGISAVYAKEWGVCG